MRVQIPEFKNKKDLISYLKDNKSKIISEKKQGVIYSDEISLNTQKIDKSSTISTKANAPVETDVDKLRVKVVANTSNWIDSHLDMLLPGAYTKSLQERKNFIPHLHDHIHQLGAKVGEVVDIFTSNLSYSELGINGSGSTEALIFITDILKSYDEKVFNQYKLGKVNQHSIGLQYVKLDLAINDEDSEKEFDFWNKYIGDAINPEVAEARGFFWVVQEIKLIENSAVLFGANEITPTLDNDLKTSESACSTQKSETSNPPIIQSVPGGSFGDLLSNFKIDL